MRTQWNVAAGDGVHKVGYSRNIWGTVTVTVDEDSFRLGHVSLFAERREPFRVGDSQCLLVIRRGRAEILSTDCEVALSV